MVARCDIFDARSVVVPTARIARGRGILDVQSSLRRCVHEWSCVGDGYVARHRRVENDAVENAAVGWPGIDRAVPCRAGIAWFGTCIDVGVDDDDGSPHDYLPLTILPHSNAKRRRYVARHYAGVSTITAPIVNE
jgi:hypothetical protein